MVNVCCCLMPEIACRQEQQGGMGASCTRKGGENGGHLHAHAGRGQHGSWCDSSKPTAMQSMPTLQHILVRMCVALSQA